MMTSGKNGQKSRVLKQRCAFTQQSNRSSKLV